MTTRCATAKVETAHRDRDSGVMTEDQRDEDDRVSRQLLTFLGSLGFAYPSAKISHRVFHAVDVVGADVHVMSSCLFGRPQMLIQPTVAVFGEHTEGGGEVEDLHPPNPYLFVVNARYSC